MSKIRRGQFFIIGVLLIASIITGYIVLDVGGIDTPQTQAPRQLFDRAMNEFPATVNQVTAADSSPESMQRRATSFLDFQQYTFASHGITTRSHAFIGVPTENDITFLLANFHGDAMNDVRVTVDGTTQTRSTILHGETAAFTFTGVPKQMEVRAAFDVGRSFNQSYTASRARRSALYHLRLIGEDQSWQGTRIY